MGNINNKEKPNILMNHFQEKNNIRNTNVDSVTIYQ